MGKVALIGPTDRSIWYFRRGLIKSLVERGFSVYVICNPGEYVTSIQNLGAICVPVFMYRFMDFRKDIKYLWSLYRIFLKHKFDFIHTFTIKPNVFGSIAGRFAGIRRIYALVEGLGFGYSEESGFKPWLSRQFFLMLYRLASLSITKIWFINQDDKDLFEKKKIIKSSNAVFIRSIGVDLEEYSLQAVEPEVVKALRHELGEGRDNLLYVTMVARMIWSKGVKEFVEAANILSSRHPNARFLLVGEIQADSPQSVPEDYLKFMLPPNVRWLNFRTDIPALLAASDIVVLPSYYREGVPRSLLEGMAMGKPLVTTDYPGCREVVKDGYNGYLVPIRDAKALAEAISHLLSDSELRAKMGYAGREWAEREFDEKYVVARVLHELYGLE